MLDFAKRYGKNVYSQNGEDGIIQECLKRMNIRRGVAVEFGAADGLFCSNTANLGEWTRFLYDISEPVNGVIQKAVTPENVNDLPKCDLLSIDIDGNDYSVWKSYKGRPAIVVIEINSDISPEEKVYDKGTSYSPMVQLGISKGYFLLCHTGNLVFVDNKYKKLFPEVKGNPLLDFQNYFNYSWVKKH